MINLEANEKLYQLKNTFKDAPVIGSRKSVKGTLVKATFPNKP
jgi:hypothetical protein